MFAGNDQEHAGGGAAGTGGYFAPAAERAQTLAKIRNAIAAK